MPTKSKLKINFRTFFYSFSNNEAIILESFFCAAAISVALLSRQSALKEHEEILKWFPYGGNYLHAEQ